MFLAYEYLLSVVSSVVVSESKELCILIVTIYWRRYFYKKEINECFEQAGMWFEFFYRIIGRVYQITVF